uniref:Integrase core domain containing protein n=1 Tax=Solanum tuberosum TaxID=4113 RepID=M1DGD8_SOLTU
MNFATETETTKHGKKDIASTWGPLDSIMVRGTSVNISKSIVSRMLHGPEYTTLASVGLFEGKHHVVTSEAEIEVQSSHERIMHWIARQISSEGENASWVTRLSIHITKASLSFSVKVWWAIVCAQLKPTDQRQTRTLVDQIVCRMPQLIEQDVLTAEKKIKDEMRKELLVLKDRMDGLEVLVQERLQAAGSVNTDEFKMQLAEIGVPFQVSGSQPDPELVSESAPVDKGADADPAVGA